MTAKEKPSAVVSVNALESYQWRVTREEPGERVQQIVNAIDRIEETDRASFRRKPLLICGLLKAQRAIQFHSVWGWVQRVVASIAVIIVSGWVVAGCTTYEPPPPPLPSPFDRAWNAALGAAQDEGVQVTSADRVSGVIRGYRAQQEVTIKLQTQADGNVRIEMSARGPKGSDPGLAERISRAYDRRMGR